MISMFPVSMRTTETCSTKNTEKVKKGTSGRCHFVYDHEPIGPQSSSLAFMSILRRKKEAPLHSGLIDNTAEQLLQRASTGARSEGSTERPGGCCAPGG